MPNVTGLSPAPDLLAQHPNGATGLAYGPHCHLSVAGDTITLFANADGNPLATVTGGKPRARLDRVNGDTVTAVNAFLRPFGKVKTYWRTGEYRWHPLNGEATAPAKGTKRNPALAPASVVAPRDTVRITLAPAQGHGVTVVEGAPATVEVENLLPQQPVAPVAVAHPATTPVVETARTWRDRYSKRPVAKPVTKSYSIVGDVLTPTSDLKVLDAMKRLRDAGKPAFGLVTGPAGTAKTRLAVEWGFANDLPVVVIDGMSIQTAPDWYGGTIQTADGRWEWEWSDAAKMILTGQPCLIVVDELNRPENERALNGIMPLTDWKGTVKPLGAPHALRLAPGQCIIATLNEGIEYVGTVEIDAATRDRFGWGVRMAYTSEVIESRILRQQVPGLDADVAKRLVRVAAGQRAKRDDDTLYPSHNVISTRVLVDVANGIVIGGLEPKEALWGAVRSRFWVEDEAALTVLIEAQFGPDAAPSDDLADDDDVEQFMVGSDD